MSTTMEPTDIPDEEFDDDAGISEDGNDVPMEEDGGDYEDEGGEDENDRDLEADADDYDDDDGPDTNEQNDNDDDDDIDFDVRRKKRTGKDKKSSVPKKKKKSSRSKKSVLRFFDEQAEDAADSEEEFVDRTFDEEVLDEDEIAARERVDKRHEQNRERLTLDAKDIAAKFEQRARDEARFKSSAGIYEEAGIPSGGPRASTVMQQSLLPSIADPSIWRVKCTPGKEQQLVLSIMRKVITTKASGGQLKIKSVFCSGSKGYIYVEAMAEPLARDVLTGFRGLYNSQMQKIAVQEMTSLLNVTVARKPLQLQQWVRITRGNLKGDLARIVDIYDGGDRVMIQAVPRPDYKNESQGGRGKSSLTGAKTRPPQRLFDLVELKNAGGESFRKYHPAARTGERYDFWNNEYYKDGFLYKAVNPTTYLTAVNVKPKIEEQKMFLATVKSSKEPEDDEDEEAMAKAQQEEEMISQHSMVKALAESIGSQEREEELNRKFVSPFVVGDLVQVTGGELRNLVAKVVATNEISKTVKVKPMDDSTGRAEFTVEMSLLVKYITPGSHVKVINGQYMGQTGRVVSVNAIDGKPIAAILTDGINTEIQCDVNYVQMSTEVTTGLGSLMGYELYDLVMLSENESAVIIAVGAEKLRVMNHAGIVKEVFPMEIQSQRNSQSLRSTAIDSGDNSMKVGDVVNVISGEYAKKSGTIKHIMKGSLWLHSNSHLKNSGIFVTRGRAVVVAGSKTNTGASSMSMSITIAGRRGATAVTSAINSGIGTKIVPGAKPNHKVGKDSSIGTTVRITKGQYKGHMAQIVDATGDHYSVELLTQMKKISIEKAKTVPVGDKGGSRTRSNDEAIMANVVPSTPFLTAETPRHALDTPLYAGNETPGYGNQTPGRTPNSYYDDLWNENDADDRNNGNNDVLQPNSLNAHNNIESGSQIHDYSVNDGGSRTANDPSHNPLSRDSRYHNNINPLSSNSWTLGSSDDNSRRSQAGTPSISTNDAISPQSSMYSPANAKESPFVNNSIANKNKSYDQQVEEKKGVPPNEWVENMIMCIRKKAMAGKIAVIKDVSPMSNGKVSVQAIRDDGVYVGRPFNLLVEEVVPIELTLNKKVIVTSGKTKGKIATVKRFAGADVIVGWDDEGSSNALFRPHQIAHII